MENGWKTQLRFERASFQGGELKTAQAVVNLKRQTAPRLLNVNNVLEAYDLFGKKIYQEHAMALLSRFPATASTNCWEVAHNENLGRRSDGVLRRTLEELKIAPDPTLGVICVRGAPRTVDSRTLALELDLGLGAHGGFRFRYPVPNFPHTWMLVRISDQKTLANFAAQVRIGRTAAGDQYEFWGELHADPAVGRDELATELAESYLKEAPRVVRSADRSNFKDPVQQAEEDEWFKAIASLRAKLGQ